MTFPFAYVPIDVALTAYLVEVTNSVVVVAFVASVIEVYMSTVSPVLS